jgi:hypothetical protein
MQEEVVPESVKNPECWGSMDKFTMVLEGTGL